MRNAGQLLSLVSALLAVGCGITEPSGPLAGAQADLTEARRLFRSQGLSDYSYVLTRGCFCTPEYREPTTVTIRGGRVVSAVSVSTGEPRNLDWYESIDGLFDSLQAAIDDDAARIQAEYDPARGYPISVYIDLDERLADEEISYEARALTPLR
jgi:hypothetical protein